MRPGEVRMGIHQLADAPTEIFEAWAEGFASMTGDEDPARLGHREMRSDESRRDAETGADGVRRIRQRNVYFEDFR